MWSYVVSNLLLFNIFGSWLRKLECTQIKYLWFLKFVYFWCIRSFLIKKLGLQFLKRWGFIEYETRWFPTIIKNNSYP